MKIALDPFMHRHLSLEALPGKVAELGYEWVELSPRGDFLEWFKAPRVYPARIKAVKRAFKDAGVGIASLLPMYTGPRTTRPSARPRSGTGSARSRSPSSWASTR